MKTYLAYLALLLFSLSSPPARAVEGYYVGGEVGYVGLGANPAAYKGAIGFGLDVGIRTTPFIDLMYRLGISSHSTTGPGSLTLYSNTLSGDFHVLDLGDLDFTLGGGAGFYFFKLPTITETNFGLNGGAGVDLKVGDNVRVGLGFRYHAVFSPTNGANYWNLMMQAGYLFGGG